VPGKLATPGQVNARVTSAISPGLYTFGKLALMARYRPPDHLPPDLLEDADFTRACTRRDLGEMFQIIYRHPAGFSVSHLARRCEMSVNQVRQYMYEGRHAQHLDIFERVADGLHIPGRMLALTRRSWETDSPSVGNANFEADSGAVVTTESLADQMALLITWTEQTNVGEGTLNSLNEIASQLAQDCVTPPLSQSLERAAFLSERISTILRTGHQRVNQTRELYAVAAKLSAVLSWIASDLGRPQSAESHANNGWVLAEQADNTDVRAIILSARSKNAFWAKRYDDAALLARRGYDYEPSGTVRVLLACQEADALQAMGNIEGARRALDRAEHARASIQDADSLGGIFACNIARQANYSIATNLRTGDVEAALREVKRAEEAWQNGEGWAYGTWAQVQIGAGIAYILAGDIDSASSVLRPVLGQPADKRLATLVKRFGNEVDALLAEPAIRTAKAAVELRGEIADYCAIPSTIRPTLTGRDS
jgi:tetratricopeptide (TPR) repeat protein